MNDGHLSYRRAKFSTEIPRNRLYTEGHFWIRPVDGRHQVGFTRFATRMLGEIVEFEFESEVGNAIEVGQAVGWFEGFKAVTELYTPLGGVFAGPNPDLDEVVESVHKRPYSTGWLYLVEGTAPDEALDAEGYAAFLDRTIDRMMGRSS